VNTRIEFDNQVYPPVKFLKVRFFRMQDFDQDMVFESKGSKGLSGCENDLADFLSK